MLLLEAMIIVDLWRFSAGSTDLIREIQKTHGIGHFVQAIGLGMLGNIARSIGRQISEKSLDSMRPSEDH